MKNGDRLTGEIKSLSNGVLFIRVTYAKGILDIQWSRVAKIESDHLFLVRTEEGKIFTGKLSTSSAIEASPIVVQIVQDAQVKAEVDQSHLVSMTQTSEGFWHRLDGSVNSGILYAKGNESIQYNLSSQVAYNRDRWSAQSNYNSTLASSNGASRSTRNKFDLSSLRRFPSSNWFYAGNASFLQSSVQEIHLETTLGTGVGRYVKNTNHVSFYLLGGLGWQNTAYTGSAANRAIPNTALSFGSADLKAFKFKKTTLDLTATVLPAISDLGRVHINTTAIYFIKIVGDLHLNLSFYGSWDNRPPPNVPGSDYGSSSGLSWTFGNK